MAVTVKMGAIPWGFLGLKPLFQAGYFALLKRRNTRGAPGVDTIEAFGLAANEVLNVEAVGYGPGHNRIGCCDDQQGISLPSVFF